VVKAEEGRITAPNGRQYELNPQWVNPSGDWHVGLKRAFDLFTTPLKERMKKERNKVNAH
jgi:tripeptidyl-peptidase-2